MGTTYGVSTVVAMSYQVENIQVQNQKGIETMSLRLTDNIVNESAKKAASVRREGNINNSNVELKRKKDGNNAYNYYTKQTYPNRKIDITI